LRKFFLRHELLLDGNTDGLDENQFEFFFADASPPVSIGEVAEGVVGIDHIFESRLKELKGAGLVLGRFFRFHCESNLQGVLEKTPVF
jgi:hypothetical protein